MLCIARCLWCSIIGSVVLWYWCGCSCYFCFFFFQAEDGIRDTSVTGVQTCALPIFARAVSDRVCPGDQPTPRSDTARAIRGLHEDRRGGGRPGRRTGRLSRSRKVARPADLADRKRRSRLRPLPAAAIVVVGLRGRGVNPRSAVKPASVLRRMTR